MTNWNLDSWKKHVAKHLPDYENIDELDEVENKLASFPPLVFAGEVRSLKSQLKEVSDGNAFLLQGCLLYTSPSPRDRTRSRMPSSA